MFARFDAENFGEGEMMDWQEKTRETLRRFGHRNWVVVADSAYPIQTAPGIEMICVDLDLVSVATWLLGELESQPHVRPVVWVDSELAFLPGERPNEIRDVLSTVSVTEDPHEEIIRRLQDAATSFQVLVLKTSERTAYTSVFVELMCGYWSDEDESGLRKRMEEAI